MELLHIKGNTFALKSWLMIGLYQLDEGRCILLDSGLESQRQALLDLLEAEGLRVVGIIGSHTHIDHMGNHSYFQTHHGARLAMPLGEAGLLASDLGTASSSYNLSPRQAGARYGEGNCLADHIILPGEDGVTLCGVTFQVLPTPGHSLDHIAILTPDNVAYLGDGVISGRTLYRAKFSYFLSLSHYLESLAKLRELQAEEYIVAHEGIYPEIRSFVDMEISFLKRRMEEILSLIEGDTCLEDLTLDLCTHFDLHPKRVEDMLYFQRATQSYLHYLLDEGHLEQGLVEGRVRYRKRQQEQGDETTLPPVGTLSVQQ